VLLSAALPELGLWVLGPIGLIPLMYLVARSDTAREAAFTAWLGGIGFFMAAHVWLAPKVGPFLLAIGILLGALWIPWGLALRMAITSQSLPSFFLCMVVVPSAWVSAEFVRSWEHMGGPWGLLGASQWNNRYVLVLAELGGIWLIGLVLVATNVAFTWLILRAPGPVRAAAVLSLGILAMLPLLYRSVHTPVVEKGKASIFGVQAGDIKGREPRFSAHERLALNAPNKIDLLVWGESSVGFDAESHPRYMQRLREVSRGIGAPVLVNVDARRANGGILKSALLVDASGPLGRYDKMRLVPFGEYVPLRDTFGWLTSVSDAPEIDRMRGKSLALFSIAGLRVGPLICFESAFPDLSRSLSRAGADLIVIQSATTTFQKSWAPEQHASLAAVRAVESGRSVIHATLSG
ncbi:MAG: apolipoprotein N-acyltransferase, partial [Acidimicrobiia bacterium]